VAGAEVDRRRGGGVSHVLGVLDPVTVSIGAHGAPGAGEELHRPDCPVEDSVPVHHPAVGVHDPCGSVRAIQGDPDDARPGHAARVQLVAAESAVVTLDPSDRSQQSPVDVTAGIDRVDQRDRPVVSGEGSHRNTGAIKGNWRRAAGSNSCRQHQGRCPDRRSIDARRDPIRHCAIRHGNVGHDDRRRVCRDTSLMTCPGCLSVKGNATNDQRNCG
jgi:hypothetical protein